MSIKSYFDNHPQVDVFYFTSDGLAFFKENDAYNHSRKLGDYQVTEITREEADELSIENENE